MARRFVFVEEVKDVLSKKLTEMELPEGTRFSPAATDLIRENGIRVSFVRGQSPDNRNGAVAVSDEHESVGRPEAFGIAGLIAVVSTGKTVTDAVGNVAARSPYFLIFNSQSELVEVLENPYRDTGGGAGPMVAEFISNRGVKTLIAENFGVNIAISLKDKGLNSKIFSGTVGEAVKSILFEG